MTQKKRIKPRRRYENLYVLEMSLEQFLAKSKNKKGIAYKANKDYSNFSKLCRLSTNITLSSYVDCADAFDMEVLIIHLPKGTIESTVPIESSHDNPIKLIARQHLATLLNQLEVVNVKTVEQQVICLLNQEIKKSKGLVSWLKRIAYFLSRFLRQYGEY